MLNAPLRSELMEMDIAGTSDAGGRTSNQDVIGSARQDELACFIVCDGVGGAAGGDVAADMTVKAIVSRFLEETAFGPRALCSYIDHAIECVAAHKQSHPQHKSMSTTVAALLIDQRNRCAVWGHMGDTRLYCLRRGKTHAVTRDHSLVQQFVDAGYCTSDQLPAHKQRSVLYVALGAEGSNAPEMTPLQIELEDGDAFLLCTDGFWEWISESDIEATLSATTEAAEWLASMTAIVERNGRQAASRRDNYSALVIRTTEKGG